MVLFTGKGSVGKIGPEPAGMTRSPRRTGGSDDRQPNPGRRAMLQIALPFVDKSDIHLARHGEEIVVTVGSYRRLLALPATRRGHTIHGARVEGDTLQVRLREVRPAAVEGDW